MIVKLRLEGRAAEPSELREEFHQVMAGLSDLFGVPCAMGQEVYERDTSARAVAYKGRCLIHPDHRAATKEEEHNGKSP